MSDIRNLVKMKELQDMFFYTFGIVPLQNYGVVGDGTTDNRLNIQQAIYDAIEIGAKYIFVPKGEYYYSNTLFRATTPALMPIAGVVIYAGKGNVPSNYLECNGQAVNTIDYIALYSKLNNIVVNEDTNLPETFNIPNLSTGQENTKYIIRAK